MADNITRITSPDDPERCQGMTALGQCKNKAVQDQDHPDLKYCSIHGGANKLVERKKESMRLYHLAKWNVELERHAGHPGIKSLRDEIGILRMMLEYKLNSIHTPVDLILQSGPISEMIMKIEKIVASCHKLEGSIGQLLDKAAVIQFAGEIIGIISEELQDVEGHDAIIQRVADKISTSLSREQEEQK